MTKNIFEKYNDKVELLSIKKEITKEEAIRIGSLRDLIFEVFVDQ